MQMSNSYAKLREGDWGIRVVGRKPSPGQTVEVTTKAGKVNQEMIGTVLWSGRDREGLDVHLCSKASDDHAEPPRDVAQERPAPSQPAARQQQMFDERLTDEIPF
jgi:hypothetical protein